jgi:signal transduction histidine kinase
MKGITLTYHNCILHIQRSFKLIVLAIFSIFMLNSQSLNAAQDIKEKTDFMNMARDSIKKLDSLYKYHEAKGNYQEAFHYFEMYKNLSDSISNIENEYRIEKTKLSNEGLELNKLEQENKIQELTLKNEKKANRDLEHKYRTRYWALALLILTFISGLFFYFYLRKGKQELKSLNDRLMQEKTLFSKSPVVTMQLKVNENFTFDFVSKNIVDMIGRNAKELLTEKRAFFDFLENKVEVLHLFKQQIKKQTQYFNFEAKLICAKGIPKDVLIYFNLSYYNNQLSSIAAYIIDISETQKLIDELEQTRNFLDKTNETAKIGGWSYDVALEKSSWTNYIYQLRELSNTVQPEVNMALAFYKEGENREKVEKLFYDAVNEGIAYDDEFQLISSTGNELWVRVTGIPVKVKDKIVRIEGIVQDITAFKNREIALKETLELAVKQNKKMQNFTHIVSHNLRSNAGNFEMLINILKEEEDREQYEFVKESLLDNSNRLKETLENLNEIIQIQNVGNVHLKSISLKAEMQKIIKGIGGLLNDTNAEVILNLYDQTTIAFIPAYFESVFQNLITNALKYRHPDRNPVIIISQKHQNDFLVIAIQDNGLGIDLKKYGHKIFGIYKTFHKHQDARGIGLYITKNQIEAIGGKIEVDSTPEVGTTFSVFIKNSPSTATIPITTANQS